MSFPYFVYIAHLTKFTRGSSPSGKIFARGKIKRGRKSWVKKKQTKKKNRSEEERESTILSRKFCDWCWWSSTLASRFRPKRSPPFQSLPYIMLKKTFPFLNASTSLDTKTLSIRCLASQHIFWFFIFAAGFFLCRWQLFSLLCRPPQRSNERSR